ncbi:MAG TPA: metallophosphoesterase family protein [Anaerolineales bacterium]|nr:metallophosphoesterase family protein [Anaerolineales bacterium]
MRILILSDIHANLTALEAVLAAAGRIDAVWCLGDMIGYGPDPNECVARMRNLPSLACVIGNHDAAALRHIETDTFNPEARLALHWTRSSLSEANLAFLAALPEKVVLNDVTLTHGSPRYPVWEYLLDNRTATQAFEHFDTSFCMVGHTHLPVIFSLTEMMSMARLIIPEPNTRFSLPPRAILNPGSVGQPRDRDPRASFLIYEPGSQTWEYRRVNYDIASVQERMIDAGLPDRHIQRLAAGW